ncbi:MAG: protein-L-isoaspartate(D-aspartate) O-methyltransferase [candidate division Zixibacteria bacterium]|nr:protein-L-isoaspartate(D-aspartate) O-methyltransferase [candidate division Zixibacteria bacterium]
MDFERARHEMVQTQLKKRGIKDRRILEALSEIPREEFIDSSFSGLAYDDGPISIGYNQTISQPYIVAKMTELLEINSTDRVLEIGSGCGYQTALLARLAGHVYSIEIIQELAEKTQERLTRMGIKNFSMRQGDGNLGWIEEAPFDKILVAAASANHAPPALVEQIAEGGKMIIPLGERAGKGILGTGEQYLHIFSRIGREIISSRVFEVRFVPLISPSKGS